MSEVPRRWWRPRLFGTILAVVLVYAGVVTLYALSGRVDIDQPPPVAGDTEIRLEPRAVDAVGGTIELSVRPLVTGPLAGGENGSLAFDEPLTLVVQPTRGQGQFEVPADQIVAPITADLVVDGAVELWPFDTYRGDETLIVPGEVIDGEFTPLAAYYRVAGDVPGWAIGVRVSEPIGAAAGDPGISVIEVTARRSTATIAFAVVLVGLMVVMPVLVLMVAVSAYRGRRKVEATLMSWMGAMLFATIPLRNFFPGSPPIGSWVDYLVVLWVIAGLIAGLTIFAAAWMRWTPRPDGTPRF